MKDNCHGRKPEWKKMSMEDCNDFHISSEYVKYSRKKEFMQAFRGVFRLLPVLIGLILYTCANVCGQTNLNKKTYFCCFSVLLQLCNYIYIAEIDITDSFGILIIWCRLQTFEKQDGIFFRQLVNARKMQEKAYTYTSITVFIFIYLAI